MPKPMSGDLPLKVSGLGVVDFAGGLVAAGEDEHSAEGEVLADHHAELDDFGVAEVGAEFGEEGGVHRAEVGRELFGEAHGQRFAGREIALRFGQMNLRDGRFVQTFTRSLRVAGEASGVAVVQRGHFEAREFLDARGAQALRVAGLVEGEVAREKIRQQFGHVQRGSRCHLMRASSR